MKCSAAISTASRRDEAHELRAAHGDAQGPRLLDAGVEGLVRAR